MRWRVEINAVHIRYIVLSWIRLHSLLFNYIQLSSNSSTIRLASHEMQERYRLPRHISSILYLRIAPLAGQSSWQSADCWLSISGLCFSSSVGWTEGGFQKSKFLSRPSSREHVSSCFSVERWSRCYSSDQFVLATIPQYSICFPGMLMECLMWKHNRRWAKICMGESYTFKLSGQRFDDQTFAWCIMMYHAHSCT